MIRIVHARSISGPLNGFIDAGVSVFLVGKHASLRHGRNLFVGQHSELQSRGSLQLGDNCFINERVRIIAMESITIGSGCLIAPGVTILDHDHDLAERHKFVVAPTVLSENVWIGEKAIVLKGVSIGRNSIVGAGSVVTKSLPENVIAAGNPATVIREISYE